MKIMFVVKSKAIEPLGAMYLSAVAKQSGDESTIVSFENAQRVAQEWKPNAIGYSVMTGDQLKLIHLNNRIVKASDRRPITIFGGPHPTFFPSEFTGKKNIDLVVRGEGEQWLSKFLGSDREYPDLDSIPFPDRTDFPGLAMRDFITSRGCPNACGYCYSQRFAELYPELPRVRFRSVENVIQEIESVRPAFAYFQDSCFGVSLEWLRGFSAEYKERIGVPFHCHLRPNQATEERVRLLANAGCASVRIALETKSERLRTLLRRGKMSLGDVQDAAIRFKEYGIKLMIQNMLAIPTSTIEDDLETLEFNIKCKPDYAWSSIFSPFPGTALGDMCIQKGWYKGDYSDITDCFFDRSVLNFDDLYKEQTYYLQKMFALCVETGYLPNPSELTAEAFPKTIHKITRRVGDRRLYRGIL